MKKFWQGLYTAVPTSSEEAADLEPTGEKTLQSKKSNPFWRHVKWFIAPATALILFTLAVFLQDSKSEGPVPETCGNSPAEAISLGCNFDIISFAWLPARCFDQELMDEFMAVHDWKWFLDRDGQHSVDLASVAAGGYDELYVTQEYHMYHCTYMWRKMHRAILAGTVLDGYIGDMHHTAHCETMILDRTRALDTINTSILTKYVRCPFAQEDFQGRWGWYRVINGQRVYRDA